MYFLARSFGGFALSCLFLVFPFELFKRALSCVFSLLSYVLEHSTRVLEHILMNAAWCVHTVLEHIERTIGVQFGVFYKLLLSSILGVFAMWHATVVHTQGEPGGPSHSCGMPHAIASLARLFSLSILSQRDSLIEYPNLKIYPYGRI